MNRLGPYSNKRIPYAKFEFGSFPSFEVMTLQNFPLKQKTSHQIRIFTPGK